MPAFPTFESILFLLSPFSGALLMSVGAYFLGRSRVVAPSGTTVPAAGVFLVGTLLVGSSLAREERPSPSLSEAFDWPAATVPSERAIPEPEAVATASLEPSAWTIRRVRGRPSASPPGPTDTAAARSFPDGRAPASATG